MKNALTEKDLARLARVVFLQTGLKEKNPQLEFDGLLEGVRQIYRNDAAAVAEELGFTIPGGKRTPGAVPVFRRLDDFEIERLAKAVWSGSGEKELGAPPDGTRWVWVDTGRPVHPEEFVSDWEGCRSKHVFRRIARAVAVELGFSVDEASRKR